MSSLEQNKNNLNREADDIIRFCIPSNTVTKKSQNLNLPSKSTLVNSNPKSRNYLNHFNTNPLYQSISERVQKELKI